MYTTPRTRPLTRRQIEITAEKIQGWGDFNDWSCPYGMDHRRFAMDYDMGAAVLEYKLRRAPFGEQPGMDAYARLMFHARENSYRALDRWRPHNWDDGVYFGRIRWLLANWHVQLSEYEDAPLHYVYFCVDVAIGGWHNMLAHLLPRYVTAQGVPAPDETLLRRALVHCQNDVVWGPRAARLSPLGNIVCMILGMPMSSCSNLVGHPTEYMHGVTDFVRVVSHVRACDLSEAGDMACMSQMRLSLHALWHVSESMVAMLYALPAKRKHNAGGCAQKRVCAN